VSLHDVLANSGVEGSWGVAIILFTLLVKAVTFPLNYKQIESTTKMQQLQPKIKQLQLDYATDQQRMNQEMALLYQNEEVNPLAGCLPSLAQIPVFIALYRALLALAENNKLDESFLWLPSLDGPVTGINQGMGWLTEWVDGAPPLGWHDTLCYLSLPAILVVTQSFTQRLMTPKSDDPAQQQTQAILSFLPFMVGWFSLTVPSGLSVYWIVNNAFTTASSLFIKSLFPAPEVATAAAGGGTATTSRPPPAPGSFRPPPSVAKKGFSAPEGVSVTVRPPSAPKAAPAPAPAPTAAGSEVVDVEVSEVSATADGVQVAASASEVEDGLSKSQAKKKSKARAKVRSKKKKNP